jgi:hypothetical protein
LKSPLFGIGIVALLATACTGSSTGPSQSLNLSGNWSGSISDTVSGAGTIRLTLAQSGSSITGTEQSVYNAGTGSGSLTGSVNGLTLTGIAAPSVPTECQSSITAAINSSGTQISGTAATFDCTAAESATFTVTKQ